MDGISCVDSMPYSSLDLKTASAVCTLIALLQLLCLQNRSSFFKVTIVLAILLLISSLFVAFIPIVHPRYVAVFTFGTVVLSLKCTFSRLCVVINSHLFLLSFSPYLCPCSSIAFRNLFIASVLVVIHIVSSA